MELQRIIAGTAATISVAFEAGGLPAATEGAATVTIVRDSDGEAIVTDGATDGSAGAFSRTLGVDETAELDLLTASWTATVAGVEQTLITKIELVGGFTFRLSELRKSEPALGDVATYTAEDLDDARTAAEQALEDRNGGLGWAMVPRYRRDRIDPRGASTLPLMPLVRRVRSMQVGDTALPAVAVVGGAVPWEGHLERHMDAYQLSVAYEHGADEVPARGKQAAMRLARHFLLPSPIDDRAIRVDTDASTYTRAMPGMRGNSFGIPDVDSFVKDYGVGCPEFASIPISG